MSERSVLTSKAMYWVTGTDCLMPQEDTVVIYCVTLRGTHE